MVGVGRQGRPEEEMFLSKPSTEPETPTVEPLRISKLGGASPAGGDRLDGSSIPSNFPLPPGSTSSPNPLPYPNDRPTVKTQNSGSSASSYKPYHPPGQNNERQQATSPSAVEGFSPIGEQKPVKLAERRGNVIPKPLPDSPGQDITDGEGLFAKPPQRAAGQQPPAQGSGSRPAPPDVNPFPEFHQQYWPPPGAPGSAASPAAPGASNGGLAAPKPTIGRFDSTATTKATRGSPPPPETPATDNNDAGPAADIEARYAAAGIAGAATLTSLQAQGAAAAHRANQYGGRPPPQTTASQQAPPRRPWTPTEQPGSQPYGPPTVYQGPNEVDPSASPPVQQPTPQAPRPGGPPRAGSAQNALEQDFQRMQLTSSPPPAYDSVGAPTTSTGYPNEKHGAGPGHMGGAAMAGAGGAAAGAAIGAAVAGAAPHDASQSQSHPAFANDPAHQLQSPQPGKTSGDPVQQTAIAPPAGGAGPSSPPPLPEGWIAHLDQNSGQYYYIHLPTQSTQWEFPKGPLPNNMNEPTSPVGSVFSAHPLASPGLSMFGKHGLASPMTPGFAPPGTPGYAPSVMSMSMSAATPTAAGISGPPPSSGVDMYKVAPTNGVYFGPYLRYTNMDMERGLWLGSIMLVTDAPQPPTIHIHQSVDLSPNPRQLKANPIFTHQRWVFYRYDVDLQMEEAGSAKWTYAITSHLGCTRYEFLVAGRYESGWRFIAHSGNDFALTVSATQRENVGGISLMWKDIMEKHIQCSGFHTQLGLGDQIYADRMWKDIPLLKQWLATSGKENRKNAPWTAKHDEDVNHAYFHYYTSHFDQPQIREAFAQIPHVLQIDDHDIFAGFGSYPEYMQFSHMFKNIGRIGIEMYLLFQHHTTLEILRNVSDDRDLFTITGTGWHFVKYLGPALVVIGPDCRSERNPHQVMAGPTYQGIFPKVATLPPSVQHCIWMISVPLVYPRLEAMESLTQTVATGKKAVTGAYNLLGKATSSAAGVFGAKAAVAEGFTTAKRAVGKTGALSSILNPFGDIEIADEIRDSWTHDSKDLERTYLIRTLQGISHQKSIRMTFFSGDVGSCGAGLLHDPAHPSDHKTMYQIISSSIVGASPPPGWTLKMLHNNKPLYIPANGHKSTNAPSDTKEDMMEVFGLEPDGRPRELKKLCPRRNYVACVAFDPDMNGAMYGVEGGGRSGKGMLSLAVDFMVQGEGAYGAVTTKYGPVVIPNLEFGR